MSATGSAASLPLPEEVAAPGHDRYLPTWKVGELPAPPKFGWGGIIRVIGPGAIALSMSIGSGEWLIGPAVTVQFGLVLLWITTVAVFLQVVFNTEAIRYTLYTGEPILTGIMRTWPGPRVWGTVYWLFSFLSNVWPGWAATAATALASTGPVFSAMPTPVSNRPVSASHRFCPACEHASTAMPAPISAMPPAISRRVP